MAQSFFQMYGHLIFSTKERKNWLDGKIRKDVHSYIATICRNMGCPFVYVGGAEDHIHILMDIGKEHATTTVIGTVKKDTSKFIKKIDNEYQGFYWQSGYGLFSVSPAHKDKVINYIDNQLEHHKQVSFKDEYLAFLQKYKIEYNEKYLWE